MNTPPPVWRLAALVLALAMAPAQAAGADPRALHIVVPFTPGGAQDLVGRFIGTKLSARLGLPVVIDNRAGAGGVIAAEAVAKAAPDGKTLLLASGGAISIAPSLAARLPYDVKRDFAAVALLADTPMTLAVRTNSPFGSVADVLREARLRPGRISFGSTGNGTVTHLTGELLAQTAGVQLLHVPYRGAGPAVTDLLGGQVDLLVTSVASVDPMVDDKKARLLGTFTATRLPGLKDTPTIAEGSGLKDLAVPVWMGLLAPAKTSPALLNKLSTELVAICLLPETQERFGAISAIGLCGGHQALEKVIAEDTQRWARVIQQAGIKTE